MTQEINSNIRIIHAVNGPITETITIRPIEEKDNKEIAALIRKVFEEFDAPTFTTSPIHLNFRK